MESRFRNRREAGQVLAGKLLGHVGKRDVLVLAIPRGGVPVAFEVARMLHAPLDVFLVRKLGFPGNPELAMGAITSGGVRVLDAALASRVPVFTLEATARRELAELQRRERLYRDDHARRSVRGKSVILVDDGLATGATMRAAVTALRAQRPERIVGAVPVGAGDALRELRREMDELICAVVPQRFHAAAQWYDDFAPTSDLEVQGLLEEARRATRWLSVRPGSSVM